MYNSSNTSREIETMSIVEDLHSAVRKGNAEAVHTLLLQHPSFDVNARDSKSGVTAVYIAAQHGHVEVLRALLVDHQADPCIPTVGGATPMHIAAENGHDEVLTLLAENGAGSDLSKGINGGWTPLHVAADNGHAVAVRALAHLGATLLASMDSGATPMFIAVENGHLDVVTAFVELFSNNNKGIHESAGGVPLLSLQEVLLKSTTNNGWSMLHIAVVNGHAHVLAYLLGILLAECESSSARAELEDCSAVLMTTAAEFGHADVIYVLATQLHADVNVSSSVATTTTDSVHGTETRNEDGLTRQHSAWPPLFSAAEYGSVDAIHALIDLGADVHAVTVSGATPLHIAAENGHVDAVRALVKHCGGALLTATTHDGAAPAHVAAEYGHVDVLTFLAEVGPNLMTMAMSEGGWTPLMIAVERGHLAVVQMLLALDDGNVVNVNAAMKGGLTAAYIAAENGHLDVLRVLVEDFGADVNRTTEGDEWACIIIAARNGHVEVLRALVDEFRADVYATTVDGWSACHAAAASGHAEVIRALIAFGADESVEDSAGCSPWRVAMDYGHTDVAQIIDSVRS